MRYNLLLLFSFFANVAAAQKDSTIILIEKGRYHNPVELDKEYRYYTVYMDSTAVYYTPDKNGTKTVSHWNYSFKLIEFKPHWKWVDSSARFAAHYIITDSTCHKYIIAANYRLKEFVFLYNSNYLLWGKPEELYPGTHIDLESHSGIWAISATYGEPLYAYGCVEHDKTEIRVTANGYTLPVTYTSVPRLQYTMSASSKEKNIDFVIYYDHKFTLWMWAEGKYKPVSFEIRADEMSYEF